MTRLARGWETHSTQTDPIGKGIGPNICSVLRYSNPLERSSKTARIGFDLSQDPTGHQWLKFDRNPGRPGRSEGETGPVE
jgi:hypothetical protein